MTSIGAHATLVEYGADSGHRPPDAWVANRLDAMAATAKELAIELNRRMGCGRWTHTGSAPRRDPGPSPDRPVALTACDEALRT